MNGPPSAGPSGSNNNNNNPGTSADFVRKLYRMLEEEDYHDVVRWSPEGTSFIVFDNADFTKNILPKHFKHSNFASFVRQLNKYDFHKVRNNDESGGVQYAEGVWEFQHPLFKKDDRDLLEGIKRKPPTQRKPGVGAVDDGNNFNGADGLVEQRLHQLVQSHGALGNRVNDLAHQFGILLHEMQNINRRLDAHRDAMAMADINLPPNSAHRNMDPALQQQQQQQQQHMSPGLMNGHHSMGMGDGMGFQGPHSASSSSNPTVPPMTPMESAQRNFGTGRPNNGGMRIVPPAHQHFPAQASPALVPTPQSAHHPNFLHPNSGFPDDSPVAGEMVPFSASATPQPQIANIKTPRQFLGSRKQSEHVQPNWIRPPRCLLVEDDITCSRIGIRFLTATGCESDNATDGLQAITMFREAIAKNEPYDCIFMDIVMPRLDGCNATSVIRQEYPGMSEPPIIAMTSNIQTDDINKYFRVGMIDVLPKPFNRHGLLVMLQKHLPELVKSLAVDQTAPAEATDPMAFAHSPINATRPKIDNHHSAGPGGFQHFSPVKSEVGSHDLSPANAEHDSPGSGEMALNLSGDGLGLPGGNEYTYMSNFAMDHDPANDIYNGGGVLNAPGGPSRRMDIIDELHARKRQRFQVA